jgi:hypothetical protein
MYGMGLIQAKGTPKKHEVHIQVKTSVGWGWVSAPIRVPSTISLDEGRRPITRLTLAGLGVRKLGLNLNSSFLEIGWGLS